MTLHIAEQRKRIHKANPKLLDKGRLLVVVVHSEHDDDTWTSPCLVCLKLLSSTFFYQHNMQNIPFSTNIDLFLHILQLLLERTLC